MTQELSLYPLSAPNGQPIPLDIIQGIGLIKQDFTSSAVDDVVIPACDFVYLYATEDCIVAFGKAVVAPANGEHKTDTYIIPANTLMVLDHKATVSFGVIRVTADGTLWMQTVTKYKDVRKAALFDHN